MIIKDGYEVRLIEFNDDIAPCKKFCGDITNNTGLTLHLKSRRDCYSFTERRAHKDILSGSTVELLNPQKEVVALVNFRNAPLCEYKDWEEFIPNPLRQKYEKGYDYYENLFIEDSGTYSRLRKDLLISMEEDKDRGKFTDDISIITHFAYRKGLDKKYLDELLKVALFYGYYRKPNGKYFLYFGTDELISEIFKENGFYHPKEEDLFPATLICETDKHKELYEEYNSIEPFDYSKYTFPEDFFYVPIEDFMQEYEEKKKKDKKRWKREIDRRYGGYKGFIEYVKKEYGEEAYEKYEESHKQQHKFSLFNKRGTEDFERD